LRSAEKIGEATVYHTIEFNADFTLDLVISRKLPLERVLIAKGSRLKAEIKPYVIEEENRPIEVADLFFEDGTTAPCVKFAWFEFVD
jgi:hypothetical protein